MAYLGHTLMDNRNGLIVGDRISHATGAAEREAALELLTTLPGEHRKTAGTSESYDTEGFISQCRTIKITPHVAQKDKTSQRCQRSMTGRLTTLVIRSA